MRWKLMDRLPDMVQKTYDLVAQVPEGRVTTYGDVAKALGDVVASRFVGLAMSINQDIVRVPCRRVVQSDGFVGGYTGGGPTKKARLLRGEGIRVVGGKVIDLDRVRFSEFRSDYPLRQLRSRQRNLRKYLDLSAGPETRERVAGIDIAYDGDRGYAAMVTFDLVSGKELDRTVVEGDASFPYIPTYLAFREIPLIRSLMRLVDEHTVVMYDGNGTLHPEGFGIASQIGVVFDVPTIGVAKKPLCGTIQGKPKKGSREVLIRRELAGYAISRGRTGNPVFVSPGHRVTPVEARDIAIRYMRHRVPEPTRVAHIVAGTARREAIKK